MIILFVLCFIDLYLSRTIFPLAIPANGSMKPRTADRSYADSARLQPRAVYYQARSGAPFQPINQRIKQKIRWFSLVLPIHSRIDQMKRKEIRFNIEQDDQNIPQKIYWEATDNPNEGLDETRAIVVGVWDQFHRGTLFIPLWTNDMAVFDMKRMCIEMVGLLSDTVKNATGDEEMAQQMDDLAARLSRRLREEMKAEEQ